VLVNRGTGYRPVKQTMEVSAGDQIMVKPKGEAHLTYPDGCTVLLRQGAVYIVTTQSPCVNKGNLYETPASLSADAVFAATAGVSWCCSRARISRRALRAWLRAVGVTPHATGTNCSNAPTARLALRVRERYDVYLHCV
jgi:hypothetical protein